MRPSGWQSSDVKMLIKEKQNRVLLNPVFFVFYRAFVFCGGGRSFGVRMAR
jgi:hypothetical protein